MSEVIVAPDAMRQLVTIRKWRTSSREALRRWIEGTVSRLEAPSDGNDDTTNRRRIRLFVLPALLGPAVFFAVVPIEPDASYYTGGVALFPAPVGTLLGTLGGYTGLAVLNAVSAAAIILLVGLLAGEVGGSPVVAQALALIMVPGDWFQASAMDAPAIALLLLAALLAVQHRARWAVAVAVVASGTHLAALPLAIGAIIAYQPGKLKMWVVSAVLAATGVAVASVTSYRSGFRVLQDPHSFVVGGHELLHACWPLLLLGLVTTLEPRARFLVYGSAAGAVVAGAIPASVGQLNQTRYAIPVLFVAAASLRFRRRVTVPPSTRVIP